MIRLGIWQLVWIVILVLNLGINLAMHGERRRDNYNFFTSVLGGAISFFILYMGGFFS